MSDSSHTHSYFLWHIARILLTLAIVGLPILGGMYGASVLLWNFSQPWLNRVPLYRELVLLVVVAK